MAEIIWSAGSEDDLRSIYQRISKDSPKAADELITRITSATDRLTEFPMSGRVVPEFSREDIREVIVGNYRIVYRLGRDTIGIAKIHHGARLLRQLDLGL